MNARSWTSWCSAAMLAGASVACDQPALSLSTPPALNYNLAETQLPAPAFLKTLKPAASQQPSWASKPEAAALPKSVTDAKPAPISTMESVPIDPPKPPLVAKKAEAPLPSLPAAPITNPTPAPKTLVEAAALKPDLAPVRESVVQAAYLPAVDDHMKCLECLKALSASPIEADRKAALADLAKLQAWKQMKTAYLILRRVALTEYNTKMRSDTIGLLGQAMMEHPLVADTLKLSAQYDSDAGIRAAAMGQLERLAATPPDRTMR